MNQPWHLSVDFGTNNSAAAHTSPLGESVETLALSHRSNLMPSAVFMAEGDPAALLTGDSALSRGRRNPASLLLSPKRYIDHEEVQLAGRDVPVRTMIAAVLGAMLDRGRSQHAGQEPASVTFTHPESWSAHAVDALVDSAVQAGVPLAGIRTISEPRAAAVHYAASQRVPGGEHVAVFDFGGGTLDIAVLRADAAGDFQVVAARGDNSLGGRTVDNLLFRWVLDQVEQDDPDLADYLRAAPASVMHSLQENIREAKEILSDTSSATITVSTPAGEQDLLITRAEFNDLIAVPVERACELTQAALDQAGADKASTPIYMTGGSSRIPHMQNRLAAVGRVMTLDDPKTVVSRGALTATLLGFTRDSVPVPRSHPQAGTDPYAGPFSGAAPAAATSALPAAAPTPMPAPAPEVNSEPLPAAAAPPRQPRTQPPSQSPFSPQYTPDSRPTPAPVAPARKSTSKTPVLLGVGAVVAVGAVAAAAFALLNGGGEDAPASTVAQPPSAVAAPTTASMTTAAPTSAAALPSGSNFLPVTELVPGSADFLPANFPGAESRCEVKAKEGARISGATWELIRLVHECNIHGTEANPGGPTAGGTAYSLAEVMTGADTRAVVEQLRSYEEGIVTTLQEASGAAPEVVFIEPERGLGTYLAYYPGPQFLFLSHGGGESTAEDGRVWGEYFGFL